MTQTGDERATLLGYLDHHREVLRRKCGGLDAAQLDTALPPSDLTLGGLLKHLAYVESWWTRAVLLGADQGEPWTSVDWRADADWDWHSARDDSPEELWALYESTVATSDTILAAADLDALAVGADHGRPVNARWILVHLVEEYARHNGHADLIRQAVDGQIG